jgi:hypothetical protein
MATKKISAIFLMIALLVSSISISLIPAKSAYAADPIPKVDAWTDKGGKGINVAGGTFTAGENTVIYANTNMPGHAYWQLWGPHGKELDDNRILTAAGTYNFNIGTAEEKDIGNWQFSFGVISGNYAGSDIIKFTVVAASSPQPSSTPSAPPTTPVSPPTAAPAPSTASTGVITQWQVKIGASKNSAVDALIAMKMANKALPENLAMDLDSNGKVTAQDAKTILQRAIKGRVELSEEQKRLMGRFCAPDGFIITMGMDESTGSPVFTRLEQWQYYVVGSSFSFSDGKFIGMDEAVKFDLEIGDTKFRPNHFDQYMTLDDVTSLVGSNPQLHLTMVPELMKNTIFYGYQEGIVIGLIDDKLAYVYYQPTSNRK